MNGDGFDDVIVSSPEVRSSHESSYVVFGKAGGFAPSIDVSTLNGSNGFKILYGEGPVSTAGDVNGDGFDDLLVGYQGSSYVIYGKPAVAVATRGTNGAEVLTGSDLDDRLNGRGGDDRFNGNDGDDTLLGGDGDDLLDGSDGNDSILGQDGDDSVFVSLGQDTINGGAGVDRFNANLPGNALPGVVVDLAAQFVRFSNGLQQDLIAFEEAVGTAGTDTLTGSTAANVLIGNEGADLLSGGNGGDTLSGGAGADEGLEAGSGDDVLFVSLGRDILDGGSGTDTLDLSRLSTGATVDLGAGSLTLAGGAGRQSITGFENAFGSAGDDRLFGTRGNNQLAGDDGRDLLDGGLGRDVLRGGAGADRFVFASASDSLPGLRRDRIADFEQGLDRIDLREIDARADLAGDQAFAFRGSSGFTGAGGEFAYTQGGGNTILAGDIDGGTVADFQIELAGLVALTAGDILL